MSLNPKQPKEAAGMPQETENDLSTRKACIGEVWRLAFPIIISMASISLLGLADTLFMRWVGPDAQAAVGLGGPSVFSILSLFLGLFSGLTTFVSQYFGAQKYSACGKMLWHVLFLAIGLGIVSAFLLPHLIWQMLLFMDTNPDILDGAYQYMRVRIYGTPLFFITYTLLSFLRGIGDMKTPAIVSGICVGLNIPLTYLFTFGAGPIPAFGIVGAAIGTVLAQSVEMVLYIAAVFGKKNAKAFNTRQIIRPSLKTYWLFLKVSLPVGLSWAIEHYGWIVFSFYIGSLAKEQAAAHAIVQVFMNLAFMPGLAISIAATTLVGQYLGAKNVASAEQSAKYSTYMSVICLVALGLLFFILRYPIAHGFSDDAEVIDITAKLFCFGIVYQVFDAMGVTISGALRGAGDTRFPMVIQFIGIWLIMVPLIYYFGNSLGWGVYGAWAASSVTIGVTGILYFARFRQGRWKSMGVSENS